MKQITTYTFPGLPTIPTCKRWLKPMVNNRATLEQLVSNKLFDNIPLTKKEEKIIQDCVQFYQQLYHSLQSFNYDSLNSQLKINYFKDYLNYAFNYELLNGGYIEILETYRLVPNKDGRSKTNAKELAYPPIKVLKCKGLYNRANTSLNSIFYSSETIDAVFRECKPSKGEIVSLGIWKPKNNVTLNYYSIESNFKAKSVNEFAKRAYVAIEQLSPILVDLLKNYLLILNYEYSKKVNAKIEYIVSATLSEKLLNLDMKKDRSILEPYNYDAILYPSLGNEFNYSNLAIIPESVDEKLELKEVYEWEVLSTNYDKEVLKTNPRQLTVAKVKCTNFSNHIAEDGKINWRRR